MAIENDTADQVVKMVLQGSEVVLRLSGEAGIRLASMIYNALKGDLTTRGKATLAIAKFLIDNCLKLMVNFVTIVQGVIAKVAASRSYNEIKRGYL